MDDFIKKFHSISGTTIGERRKNLFKQLKAVGNISIDCTKLKPKNQLEESFKIDIMIYFKDVAGIINVFKSENPALIKKIVKIDWLWSAFDQHLIAEIFPKIAYNSKLKIINKLAIHLKDEQIADAIFTVIYDKYGMYLAAKLLPCCSYALINKNFTQNIIKHLHIRRLRFMLQKHPRLYKSLLENKTSTILEDKVIFRLLLQNHLELFDKLYTTTSYAYSLKLGWRATNKFVHANKAAVINKAAYFYAYLNKKQMVKSIGMDFPEFYVNMFPKAYDEFKNNVSLCLDLLDSQNVPNKFDVFASTYEKVYSADFFQSNIIDLRLFELMNDTQRLQIAAHLDIPNIVWICLSKTEKSIPALKRLIVLASDIRKRAQLVGSLVDTCRINKDYNALGDVCQYVCEKHCNDDVSILVTFLQVLGNFVPLNKFTEAHFNGIGKILKIVAKRDNVMYFQYSNCLYAYFNFLYEQNVSLKPLVLIYARKSLDLGNLGYQKNYKRSQGLEKQYLVTLGEVLPEIYKGKELQTQYVIYLSNVISWNTKYPYDKIPLFSKEAMRKALLEEWQSSDNHYTSSSIIFHILCLKETLDKSFWVETYFQKKFYTDINKLEWLIKYEPVIVSQHLSSIIDFILDMYYTQVHGFFFTMARNYHHLELPQRITKICVDVITSSDESESRKKNALTSLSYIVKDPQEFITLITPYYPIAKIEPDPVLYVMQQNISRSLGNTTPPSSMLKSILAFSKGDYTKFVRRSMYLAAFSVTEDKLGQFFSELNGLAVSVRKHAIYLGFRVLDRQSIYNIVKRNAPDKNVSIRKFLMRSIFQFFTKNPDDFLWDMLKESISNVDVDDKEALDVIVQLELIPISYMKRYVEFIANFITYSDSVAHAIPDSIYATLGVDFIVNIINSNKCEDGFICKSLINSTDEARQSSILEAVYNHYNASQLLETCADFVISNQYSNAVLLQKITNLLQTLQPREKNLNEIVHQQLRKIYIECYLKQKLLAAFTEALILLADEFITQYRPIVFHKFCETTNTFFKVHIQDEDRLSLVQSIIDQGRSKHSLILAIALLPNTVPSAPRSKLFLETLIQTLKINEHPVVCMTLSLYLNKLMPQYNIVEEKFKWESTYNRSYAYEPYADSAYAKCVLSFD